MLQTLEFRSFKSKETFVDDMHFQELLREVCQRFKRYKHTLTEEGTTNVSVHASFLAYRIQAGYREWEP